jgi:hypothetical protein
MKARPISIITMAKAKWFSHDQMRVYIFAFMDNYPAAADGLHLYEQNMGEWTKTPFYHALHNHMIDICKSMYRTGYIQHYDENFVNQTFSSYYDPGPGMKRLRMIREETCKQPRLNEHTFDNTVLSHDPDTPMRD